jgi:hypothetical protein
MTLPDFSYHLAKRKKEIKRMRAKGRLSCEHAFEMDGGPCIHCGKTWIEINESKV